MGRTDKIETTVFELTAEIAAANGVELYDVVFRRSGPRWKLQVFLDRPTGNVSLEDCERVSRQLSHELDALDPIPAAYDLEVSSPGLERALRRPDHWEKAKGASVKVRFRKEDGSTETIVAEIQDADDAAVTLRERSGAVHRVAHDSVLAARVHVDW